MFNRRTGLPWTLVVWAGGLCKKILLINLPIWANFFLVCFLFQVPNFNPSPACSEQTNLVAALPTVDDSSSSTVASYLSASAAVRDNSSHLTISNSVNNAISGHLLTLNRHLDSSNPSVIDGHLPSSDGIRLTTASAATSLPNHSSLCREPSTNYRPASLSFVSAPGSLKLAVGTQINHKDNVSRYVNKPEWWWNWLY